VTAKYSYCRCSTWAPMGIGKTCDPPGCPRFVSQGKREANQAASLPGAGLDSGGLVAGVIGRFIIVRTAEFLGATVGWCRGFWHVQYTSPTGQMEV